MKTSLFALTCALAATSPALAEDEPQSTGWTPEIIVTGVRDGYDVPAATSATRVATPVEKIPQSIQSLTRQLIEDQDLQNLTDALVNVSGIVPTSQGQAVLQPTLVRGFKVNYFIDGIPTYQLPEGAADPATLVFVDRIEVVKGPTSTLYGGGAGAPLSGLINLVSRDPSTTNLLMNAGLRAGSFNSWGGDADINLPIGAMAAFRVSGMVESADSFIDFVTMDRFGIFPSLLVKLGPDTRLVVRGRYNKIEQTEYAGLPVELIKPNLVIDRNAFCRRARCPAHIGREQGDHRYPDAQLLGWGASRTVDKPDTQQVR